MHTVLKVKFLSKNSILTKLYFWTYLNFGAKIRVYSRILKFTQVSFFPDIEYLDKIQTYRIVCLLRRRAKSIMRLGEKRCNDFMVMWP